MAKPAYPVPFRSPYPKSSGTQGPGYDAVFEWEDTDGTKRRPQGYIPVPPSPYSGEGGVGERPATPLGVQRARQRRQAEANRLAREEPDRFFAGAPEQRAEFERKLAEERGAGKLPGPGPAPTRRAAARKTSGSAAKPKPKNVRYQQGKPGQKGASSGGGPAGKPGKSTQGKAGSSNPGSSKKGKSGSAGKAGKQGKSGSDGGRGKQGKSGKSGQSKVYKF